LFPKSWINNPTEQNEKFTINPKATASFQPVNKLKGPSIKHS
jgi:hypothetical protein